MRNVLDIFRQDLAHLMTNMIACVVVLGLIIVPPMYAWLTTLGFWNPYANTGNLPVAVVNEDAGYTSPLIATGVNVGKNIVGELHENDGFRWEFMGKDEAMDKVSAGDAYAAIVIPSDFSKKLFSLFTGDAQPAVIEYYVNEEENAIAPHVTGQGATELQTQIDDTFTKTVADISLSALSSLSGFMDGEGLLQYGEALAAQLATTADDIGTAEGQMRSLADIASLSAGLVGTSKDILDRAGAATTQASALERDAQTAINDGVSAVDGMADAVNASLAQAQESLAAIETAVNQAYDSMQNDPAAMQSLMTDLGNDAQSAAGVCDSLKSALQAMGGQTRAVADLNAAASALGRLADALRNAGSTLGSSTAEMQASKDKALAALNDAKQALGSTSSSLEDELLGATGQLSADLQGLLSASESLGADLRAADASIGAAATPLADGLQRVHDALASTADVLGRTHGEVSAAHDEVAKALASRDIEQLRTMIGSDPSRVAAFLSAPTQIDRHAVDAIANNGSSMSSFYSSLSLWIGAVFLVALTSVNVSPKQKRALADPKPWQLYLGRYGIFAVIALLQAVVLVVGNVFFVGIQMEHFWLYLLACCVCALVFSNLVYTLTISFGNVGKAIAIVGLVMQLAGTGGIMPIVTSAPIFQAIYPWLPFAHSIEALSSCVAGIYGSQYLVSVLCLLAFLVPSLLLGLVFRRPMIRANDYFQAKLAETKFL